MATVPAGKRRGVNRVDWTMRRPAPKIPPAASLAPAITGPRVPEGHYTFVIKKGAEEYEGSFDLVADPRGGYSREDRAIQQRLANDLYDALEELTYVIEATVHLRDATRSTAAGASGRGAARLRAYADELEVFRASRVATAEGGPLTGEEKLREQLAEVFGAIAGFDGPPTQSQVDRAAVLAGQVGEAFERYRQLSSETRLGELNRSLATPLEPLTRERWQAQQEASRSRSGFSAKLVDGLVKGVWRPFATR
ncbi:MAG TPA: hypothetical protein VMV46_23705 [Thermoanaerobaculia bacterium]|nr:hypothetical protein [Thermoanaerobaculia bacterium]